MLTVLAHPKTACDGLTRRDLLKAGALSLFGQTLTGRPLPAAATARPRGRVRSVILLDLFGGPSHIDTFDPKPEAPAEIRGEFRSIPTRLPGVQVCEHLPRLANWLDRTCLIRTLSHSYNSHNPYAVMTGFTGGQDQRDYFSRPSDHPSMGSLCHSAGLTRPGVPPYVVLPAHPGYSQGLRRCGPYGGYLGSQFNPLFASCEATFAKADAGPADTYNHELVPLGEPRLPSLQPELTLDALDRRRTLLEQFDQQALARESDRGVALMSRRQQEAFDLLLTPLARTAFDLDQEPLTVRDRYGRDVFGASVLLARRLVEAGVTFVTVHTEAKANGHWDTHANNFGMLRHWLLPFLDRAVSNLLQDLVERGLFDSTLVLVTGDMGRTPRINAKAGRDHWTACGFCLLAGGGVKQGLVYGASDRSGAYVKDLPVSPGDLVATVYQLVGIDPEMTVNDLTGRPHPISHGGQVVQGVLA